MRKVLSWVLLFWPYLLFPCGYFMIRHSDPIPVFVFMGSSLVLFLTNIIVILLAKDIDGGKKLALWNMVTKLAHIPFYVVLFCIAAMTIAAPVIGLFAVVFDCLLLAATSVYGIKALILAQKRETVTSNFLVVHVICHLIFVMDVFSSVALYIKLRKQAIAGLLSNECNTQRVIT